MATASSTKRKGGLGQDEQKIKAALREAPYYKKSSHTRIQAIGPACLLGWGSATSNNSDKFLGAPLPPVIGNVSSKHKEVSAPHAGGCMPDHKRTLTRRQLPTGVAPAEEACNWPWV